MDVNHPPGVFFQTKVFFGEPLRVISFCGDGNTVVSEFVLSILSILTNTNGSLEEFCEGLPHFRFLRLAGDAWPPLDANAYNSPVLFDSRAPTTHHQDLTVHQAGVTTNRILVWLGADDEGASDDGPPNHDFPLADDVDEEDSSEDDYM